MNVRFSSSYTFPPSNSGYLTIKVKSRLSDPPAITDTPIKRTAAKSPAKTIYRRLTEINSRYCGLLLMRTLTRGPYNVRYEGSSLFSTSARWRWDGSEPTRCVAPSWVLGALLAIIISYPTSASGIIVLLKTPTKYWELFPLYFCKNNWFSAFV